jgi:glycosyltransferase involved in cell wall biosynthesis
VFSPTIVTQETVQASVSVFTAAIRNQVQWELVIVDDGSSDGTLDVARRWEATDPRISALPLEANRGLPGARNAGFAAAKEAPFVSFLDSDDTWEPETLSVLLEAAASHPESPAVHGVHRLMDDEGRPLGAPIPLTRRRKVEGKRLVRASSSEPTTFSMMVLECCVQTAGMLLLRREPFVRAGGFRAAQGPAEDWELWLRMTREAPFAAVDQLVLNYRQHPGQMIRNPNVVLAELYVRSALIYSPNLTPEERRLAVEGERLHRRDVARQRLRWAGEHVRRGAMLGATRELYRAGSDYAKSLRGRWVPEA